jgi:hypothetical protein
MRKFNFGTYNKLSFLNKKFKIKTRLLNNFSKYAIAENLLNDNYFYSKQADEFINRFGFFRNRPKHLIRLRHNFYFKIKYFKKINKLLYVTYIKFLLSKYFKIVFNKLYTNLKNKIDLENLLYTSSNREVSTVQQQNIKLFYSSNFFLLFLRYFILNYIRFNLFFKQLICKIYFFITCIRFQIGLYVYRLYKNFKISRFSIFSFFFKTKIHKSFIFKPSNSFSLFIKSYKVDVGNIVNTFLTSLRIHQQKFLFLNLLKLYFFINYKYIY